VGPDKGIAVSARQLKALQRFLYVAFILEERTVAVIVGEGAATAARANLVGTLLPCKANGRPSHSQPPARPETAPPCVIATTSNATM